jgi:hypothetical protein
LKIEFAEQSVSGFSGLELVKRYFRLIRLNSQVRRAFQGYAVAGDYSVVQMLLVMMALWLTGGRRLKHIPFFSAHRNLQQAPEKLSLDSVFPDPVYGP